MATKRPFLATSGIQIPSTGVLNITNTTSSTGSSSGALVVSGGVGIGQSVSISGRLQLFNGNNYTSFVSNASTNTLYTLPSTAPSTGSSVLQSDTSGNLSWVAMVANNNTGSGITNLNSLTSGIQYFSVGTSGTLFNISSSGSTHTFNIPIAGSGSTGLVSTQAQTFAGQKTFTSAIVADLTGTATTSGFASTSSYSHQSGYAITSGTATTSQNVNIFSAVTNSNHPLVFTPTSGTVSGTALSSNSVLTYNPSTSILSVSGLAITSGTASTSTSSGALVVTGGVGIGETLSVAGAISVNSGTNGLLLRKLVAGNYGAIYSTGVTPSSTNYTMITDGTSVNFNGTGGVYFNISNSNKIQVTSNNINIVPTAASTSTSTGALTIGGGVGIGGSLFVASATAISGVTINAGVITGNLTGTATTAQNISNSATNQNTDFTVALISGTALSYASSFVFNPSTGRLASTSYTGTWAGSTIASLYGGTGNTTYSKGDLLVGVGGTLIRLAVGTDNYILAASSSSSTGLTWTQASSSSGSGITNLNTLTSSIQYFSTGTSGTLFNISSSGSTHTFNIPIAGTASTGLVSTQSQSFAGTKTFTNDLVVSSSTASTFMANGSVTVAGGVGISGQLSFNRASIGYTGIATNPSMAFIGTTGSPITLSVLADNSLQFDGTSGKLFGINNNLSSGWIFNVGDISGLPLLRANADGTVAMNEFAGNTGIGLSNPFYKLHVIGSVGFTTVTASTNPTSGTLIVSGGVGIGQTLSVGGRLNLWNAANTFFTSILSSATSNHTYTLPATVPSTGSSVLQSDTSGNLSWVGFNANSASIATTSQNINTVSANTSSTHYLLFSPTNGGSGVAVSSDLDLSYNPSTNTLTASVFSGNVSATAVTATNIYGTLVGNSSTATTAQNVNVNATTINSTHYITFSPASSGSGLATSTDTDLTYNPGTNILTAGTFSGNLSATAATSTNFYGTLIGNVTGTATTAQNVNLAAGSNNSNHSIVFSLNSTGSGVALSSDSDLQYNPSTNALSVGTGNISANGVRIGNSSNTIDTSSGNLTIDSTGGQTNLNDNVVIQGNLTVQGTTLTVDSTVTTIVDPVIVIGSGVGGTHSTVDNNQDRGIEFRYSNSGTATTGFFGFQDTDYKFRFIPNASLSATNVYSGNVGVIVANLEGNVSATAVTSTNFYGTLIGNVTGTSTTSQNINTVSANTSATHYLLFSPVNGATGVAVSSDSSLQYNPSTNVITADVFSGNLSGTAVTATNIFGTLTGNVTGTSTTSQNINVVSANTNSNHPILFTPTSGSASGIAVSSESSFVYNPSTDILSVSGLAVTSSTASTSSSTGALIVTGGAGIGRTLNIGGRATIGSTDFGATLSLSAQNTGLKSLVIRKLASQSANTFEIQDADGNALISTSFNAGSGQTGSGVLNIHANREVGDASSETVFAVKNGSNNVFRIGRNGDLGFFSTLQGGDGAGSYETIFQNIYGSRVNWQKLVWFSGSGFNFINAGANFVNNSSQLAITNAGTTSVTGVMVIANGWDTGGGTRVFGIGTPGSGERSYFRGYGNLVINPNNPNGLHAAWNTMDLITLDISGTATTFAGNIILGKVEGVERFSVGPFGNTKISVGTATTATGLIVKAVASQTGNLFETQSSAGATNFYITPSGAVSIGATTISTSTTTGALLVTGGVGIGGSLYVASATAISGISINNGILSASTINTSSIAATSSTNSTTTSTGALTVTGGVGVGQSVSVGGRLQLFNSGNYTAFVSSASGNTVYTLPATTPSTGSSVLQSTSAGVMSWVPMTASGGLAVSGTTDGSIQFKSGSSLGATNSFFFDTSLLALRLSGFPAGNITSGTDAVLKLESTNGSFNGSTNGTYIAVNAGSGFTGDLLNLQVNATSRFRVDSSGSLIQNIGTNSTSTTSGSLQIRGGVGITGAVYIGESVNAIALTQSTSTTSGALVVSGGAGISASLNVGGITRILSSTASTSPSTGALLVTGGLGVSGQLSFVTAALGFTGITSNPSMAFIGATSSAPITLTVQNDNSLSWEGTSGQLFTIDNNLSSGEIFAVSDISGLPVISASAGQTINLNEFGGYTQIGNGSINSSSTSTGSLVIAGGLGMSGNAYIGGTTYITNTVSSTGTSSGSLINTGGFGNLGNAFIGGTTTILNTTSSSGTSSGSLINTGGLGNLGNAFIGGTTTILSTTSSSGTSSGSLVNTGGFGNLGNAFIGGTTTLSNTTNSASTASGALVVSGGLGLAGNAFIGGTSTVTNSTSSSSTASGSLVNTGGFGNQGNAFIGGTTTITNTLNSTSSATGALVVSGGAGIAKTLFVGGNLSAAGSIYFGTNTYTKSLGSGDIAFDNGTADTPASLYYWQNNRNFGTDVFYSGSGTTRYRIVKELNEIGGAELWSIDRDGIVYRSAYAVGETINTRMYNYSDLNMASTTTISSTSYTTFATVTYTPKSSTSYLWIEFSCTYTVSGTTTDDFWSNIEVAGSEIVNSNQVWTGQVGGGTRSGVLFPLAARYTNTGTAGIAISIRSKRGSSDDNATIYGNAASGFMRIQEIGR